MDWRYQIGLQPHARGQARQVAEFIDETFYLTTATDRAIMGARSKNERGKLNVVE